MLNWHLARWGYALNDGKWATPTILDMGFHSIPRAEFLRRLIEDVGHGGRQGRWAVEAGADFVAGWGEETRFRPVEETVGVSQWNTKAARA